MKSLGKSDCSAIHIKGASRLFSMFNISENILLAFYTSFDPAVLEVFDPYQADTKVLVTIQKMAKILRTVK